VLQLVVGRHPPGNRGITVRAVGTRWNVWVARVVKVKLGDYSVAVVRERKVELWMCYENKNTVREVWIYSFVIVCMLRYCFTQWYVLCEHSGYSMIVVILLLRLCDNWVI